MSATPIDPPAGRFLRSVPTTSGPDDAGFLVEDDGYWCSCSSSVVPFPSGEIVLLGIDGELDAVSLPAVAAAQLRGLWSRLFPAVHPPARFPTAGRALTDALTQPASEGRG